MLSSARFFAPGKLFIAGEYAVLNPEGKAILVPVKKGISVRATFRQRFRIRNHQRPNENQFFTHPSDIVNSRVRMAVEVARIVVESHQLPWKAFSLIIHSNISTQDMKYGLGSSGAIVVATIGAILTLYQIPFSALELYKLSVKATDELVQDSSFADLAVSSFKQSIVYSKFNEPTALRLKTLHIPDLLTTPWDGLVIEPIQIPTKEMVVIFSGVSSDSHPLVQQAKAHINPDWIVQSNQMIDAWITNPTLPLRDFSMHLRKLATQSGTPMFTPEIEQLLSWAKNHQFDAKFSGAGGGDCVLVRIPKSLRKMLVNILPPYEVLNGIISL
jgi:phosphomevalonate kinase